MRPAGRDLLERFDRQAGLLFGLADQRRRDRFAGRHEAAHRRVPAPRVGRLVVRALLDPDRAVGRPADQVDRMRRDAERPHRGALDRAEPVAAQVGDREQLVAPAAAELLCVEPQRDLRERLIGRFGDAPAGAERMHRQAGGRHRAGELRFDRADQRDAARDRSRAARAAAAAAGSRARAEHGSNPPAPGLRRRRSATSSSDQRPCSAAASSSSKPASSSTRDAELLRLDELAAGFAARHDIVGLLRHRAADLGARPPRSCPWPRRASAPAACRSARRSCRPADRRAASRRRCRGLRARSTPTPRSCSTTSRLCGWSKNVRTLCATIGPTSATSSSASSGASISRSSAPKCFARSFAVVSPTWRMPSP